MVETQGLRARFLQYIMGPGHIVKFFSGSFIILFAKENFESGRIETGNFLLSKVIGVVTAGMIITPISKVVKYKFLMYLASILALVIPLFVMIIQSASYFYLVFFIGGIVFSMYSISMKGVLLEISDNANRVLYTGIAGAGSIITLLGAARGAVALGFYRDIMGKEILAR